MANEALTVDAGQKALVRKELLKGKTPEQQAAVKYLMGAGGCLSKAPTDAEYDGMVKKAIDAANLRARALTKLGVEEARLTEMEPVCFEAYRFDGGDGLARRGADGVWRSSEYMVTWFFFSEEMVHIYRYTLDMCSGRTDERTAEYPYKDVVNFSAAASTFERDTIDKVTWTGKELWRRCGVDAEELRVVVPGDKLICSMRMDDDSERSLKAMKSKLRDKKS